MQNWLCDAAAADDDDGDDDDDDVINCSDEYESDSNGATSEDENRPQTKEELMSRALKSVVKRESAVRKQDHLELCDVPERSKRDRHHKQQKAIKA